MAKSRSIRFQNKILHLQFVVLPLYFCLRYLFGVNYYSVEGLNQCMQIIVNLIKQFAAVFGTLVLVWQIQEYPLPAVIAAATVAGLTFGRFLRWLICPRRTREVAFQTDPHLTRNYWGLVYTPALPAAERIIRGYDLPPPGVTVEEIIAGEHQRTLVRPRVGSRQAKAKAPPPHLR